MTGMTGHSVSVSQQLGARGEDLKGQLLPPACLINGIGTDQQSQSVAAMRQKLRKMIPWTSETYFHGDYSQGR